MANAEPRSLLAQSLSPWPSAITAIWNLPSGDDQDPEQSCITVPLCRCWYPLTDLWKAMKAIRTPVKHLPRCGRALSSGMAQDRSFRPQGKKGMPWHALFTKNRRALRRGRPHAAPRLPVSASGAARHWCRSQCSRGRRPLSRLLPGRHRDSQCPRRA